jgi:ASC-1-like (ASCH) protein
MKIHKMKLTTEPFDKIKSGSKIIEVRLFDEKRKDINLGDEIVLYDSLKKQKNCVLKS